MYRGLDEENKTKRKRRKAPREADDIVAASIICERDIEKDGVEGAGRSADYTPAHLTLPITINASPLVKLVSRAAAARSLLIAPYIDGKRALNTLCFAATYSLLVIYFCCI